MLDFKSTIFNLYVLYSMLWVRRQKYLLNKFKIDDVKKKNGKAKYAKKKSKIEQGIFISNIIV